MAPDWAFSAPVTVSMALAVFFWASDWTTAWLVEEITFWVLSSWKALPFLTASLTMSCAPGNAHQGVSQDRLGHAQGPGGVVRSGVGECLGGLEPDMLSERCRCRP